MSKNSSAKYYQENKQRKTTKKACEKYQSLSKEEKEKKRQYLVKGTKLYEKMKKKSWFSIDKIIIKSEKMPYYNYKKLFSFRKSVFS